MNENEVLGDLGDIRVGLIDIFANGALSDSQFTYILSLIDEKMDKYRGKKIIIQDREG